METEVNPTFNCVLGLSQRFCNMHSKLSKAHRADTKDLAGQTDVNKSRETDTVTIKPFEYFQLLV